MKILSENEMKNIVISHRNKINFRSEYDLISDMCLANHKNLVAHIGGNYCQKEGKIFMIDEQNIDILRFMTYYMNGIAECENIYPEKGYKLSKNILLIGGIGAGKSLMMQIFSDYAKILKLPMYFENISISQLINCQKTVGNIDKYTFCESQENNIKHICLNDLGIDVSQNIYGTNADMIIDEFLFSRYELYQQKGLRYHITSNLSVNEFKQKYGERMNDRFKSFNVIILNGESRR